MKETAEARHGANVCETSVWISTAHNEKPLNEAWYDKIYILEKLFGGQCREQIGPDNIGQKAGKTLEITAVFRGWSRSVWLQIATTGEERTDTRHQRTGLEWLHIGGCEWNREEGIGSEDSKTLFCCYLCLSLLGLNYTGSEVESSPMFVERKKKTSNFNLLSVVVVPEIIYHGVNSCRFKDILSTGIPNYNAYYSR